jgi:hypothetical protein
VANFALISQLPFSRPNCLTAKPVPSIVATAMNQARARSARTKAICLKREIAFQYAKNKMANFTTKKSELAENAEKGVPYAIQSTEQSAFFVKKASLCWTTLATKIALTATSSSTTPKK